MLLTFFPPLHSRSNISSEICVILLLLSVRPGGARSCAPHCKRKIAAGGGDNGEKLGLGLCQGTAGHYERYVFTLLELDEEI